MTDPTPSQWDRFDQLVDALSPLPPEQRQLRLQKLQAAGESAEVIADVRLHFELDRTKTRWEPGDRVLGRFVVVGTLGEGGMGTVYLMQSLVAENQRYAVKTVRFTRRTAELAFLTELETWRVLSTTRTGDPRHPNLLSCLFFNTVNGRLHIFSEYVEGGSLAQWIAESRITRLDQILDIAIQTAWALEAVHRLGIVHQDFKPGNVLMTSVGQPKVNDFGLARARAGNREAPAANTSNPLFSDGGMTLAYASPEQRRHEPLDHRTDIWSWGLTVLEMFCGGPPSPHGDKEALNVLETFIENGGQVECRPKMPSDLAELLSRCFQADRGSRWPSMTEVADTLVRLYHAITGREYQFARPPFDTEAFSPRALDGSLLGEIEGTWSQFGYAYSPRKWLECALKEHNHSDEEIEARLLRLPSGSRLAALIALGEAELLYENLVNQGNWNMRRFLAQVCCLKAIAHEDEHDHDGAVALYDKAINNYERYASGRQDALRQQGESWDPYRRRYPHETREVEHGMFDVARPLAYICWAKGDLLAKMRKVDDAVRSFERSIEHYERLIEGGFFELASRLAHCYVELGQGFGLKETDNYDQAIESASRALQMLREIERLGLWQLDELPDTHASALVCRAMALTNKAEKQSAQVRSISIRPNIFRPDPFEWEETLVDGSWLARQAYADFREAAALLHALVDAGHDFRRNLGALYTNVGRLLKVVRGPLGAEPAYMRAIEFTQETEQGDRASPEYLLRFHNYATGLHSDKEAITVFDELIEQYRFLVGNQDRAELAEYWAGAHQGRGLRFESLGEYDKALADMDEAIRIREGRVRQQPELEGYLLRARLYRAEILSHKGMMEEARSEAAAAFEPFKKLASSQPELLNSVRWAEEALRDILGQSCN